MSVEEGNKLIAEFMGGELIEGRQGNVYWFNDCHHVLTNHKAINIHAFKYHSSWDWQIPAWSKISHLTQELAASNGQADKHLHLVNKYESAVFTNNPLAGFNIISNAIRWYNRQKREIAREEWDREK